MSAKTLGRCLCLGMVTLAAHTVAGSNAPDAERIAAASRLLSHCEQVQADDLALLNELSLSQLDDLATLGRHAEEFLVRHDLDFHAWLRHMRTREEQIDRLAAFRALCADGQFEPTTIGLRELRSGEPASNGKLAWVPLLAPGGAGYTTLGLAFSRETDGRWGLALRQTLIHEWVLETPRLRSLRARIEAAGPGLDENGDQPPAGCRAPSAPMPLEMRQTQPVAERFQAAWHDTENLLPGPANAISTLQRIAVREHAEGLRTKADALAKAIHAEALYRSAFFRRGPLHDTPVWWTQLESAVAMARSAAAGGAPVHRVAMLVSHYAQIMEHGTPTRPADLAKAAELYEWAARQGDIGALYAWAQYQWEGIGPVPPNCLAAERTLRQLIPPDGLLERAQLAIDCPDPALRNPAQAQALLEQVRTMQKADLIWEDEQFAALELAVRCVAVDSGGPGCAARQPLLFSGQRMQAQRQQFAADADYPVDPDTPTDPADPDYDANALSPLPDGLRDVPRPSPAADEAPKRERQPGC